ncbi:MAG: alpha/beta fold hydrolase [Tabrizicola sp.]
MTNRIDQTRPTAPELAYPGPHPVGVRTLELVNPDQVDVVGSTDRVRRYDRAITVELWYPSQPGTGAVRPYETLLRDGQRRVVLHGSARRDAVPEGRYPLVILSHGYPGNRHLMAHFGENLASHGYVVASIDHRDSTYADKAPLASTLVNRPLDTEFVRASFADVAEIGTTAIIGYSMGGYGALVSAGAGVSPAALMMEGAPLHGLWRPHVAPVVSPALKAIIPIGPWGRQRDLWAPEGLAGVRVPMLVMAGSADEISGYATGMRRIFDEATAVRRHLLTFVNAGHNAAAPIPAPEEGWESSPALEFHPFEHYADAVWDTLAMNNIAQHFALAFLDLHLKGRADRADYLTDAFKGFAPGTARGLVFESLG